MVTKEEIEQAVIHEATVLMATPLILSVLWFCSYMVSVDPPLYSWGLVWLVLILIEVFDNHRLGTGLSSEIIAVRGLINVLVALISLTLSGLLVLVTGPPTTKGPLSFITTFLAFLGMLAVARIAIHLALLVNRLDFEGMGQRWNN